MMELYETGKSDKKHRFQPDIVKRYKRGIDYLKQARNIEELFLLPSLHYEVLKGDKAGVSSIRVNDQYRIEFIVDPVNTKFALLCEAALGIPAHILMGLQSDYDMQTTKNDKSFAARLKNVRKLVAAL